MNMNIKKQLAIFTGWALFFVLANRVAGCVHGAPGQNTINIARAEECSGKGTKLDECICFPGYLGDECEQEALINPISAAAMVGDRKGLSNLLRDGKPLELNEGLLFAAGHGETETGPSRADLCDSQVGHRGDEGERESPFWRAREIDRRAGSNLGLLFASYGRPVAASRAERHAVALAPGPRRPGGDHDKAINPR